MKEQKGDAGEQVDRLEGCLNIDHKFPLTTVNNERDSRAK